MSLDQLRPMHELGAAPRGAAEITIALTYGTYDLFHIGHVRLFERIKQRYDRLIVAVSTDEFNAIKGKKAVVPYADRVAMVRACRHVDEVIAEEDWGQKEVDVLVHGVDAVVMGSDWSGRFDELKAFCDVLYLPRTEGISSTGLKADVIQLGSARA
jgi:glycerol-3-phosphate cytidylyltransferase